MNQRDDTFIEIKALYDAAWRDGLWLGIAIGAVIASVAASLVTL